MYDKKTADGILSFNTDKISGTPFEATRLEDMNSEDMRQFDYALSPIDPLIASDHNPERDPTKHSPDGADYTKVDLNAAERAVTRSFHKLRQHHTVVNPKTKHKLLRLPVSVRQYYNVVHEQT